MIDVAFIKGYLYGIVGILYEVHRELGPGLSEKVYQEALEIELSRGNIPYNKELLFHPTYKGIEMKSEYRLDFLVNNDIIIELKAVSCINNEHRAQLFNYMRLYKPIAGILVNFENASCVIERYIYDKESNGILTINGAPVYR